MFLFFRRWWKSGLFLLILAIVIVQFIGVPCAFLFGMLAGRIGAKRSILVGIGAYCGITVFGYFMTSAAHFYVPPARWASCRAEPRH